MRGILPVARLLSVSGLSTIDAATEPVCDDDHKLSIWRRGPSELNVSGNRDNGSSPAAGYAILRGRARNSEKSFLSILTGPSESVSDAH